MRRMNLEEPDAQVDESIDVATRVLREAGVHAAVRQQALRVRPRVRRGERIGGVGEPHDVGRGIVHETRAPHPGLIHDVEERVGILHHLNHPIALGLLVAPHHREHLGLELAPRLDVDVDVGDAGQALQT